MRYVFILNYFADKKKLAAVNPEIEALRARHPDRVETHITEYPGHAGVLARAYSEKYGSEVVILSCGGDGTLHEISNALVGTDTPMAVIPMGTANDFARAAVPPAGYAHPELLVRKIDDVDFEPIDVMRVECLDEKGEPLPDGTKYSINITSFGIDTLVQATAKRIVASVRKSRLIRKNAYSLAVVYSLIHGWDYRMRYALTLENGSSVTGEVSYALAAVSNGRYYGNGFNPSPAGVLNDGILEACIIEDMPLIRVLPLVPKYKKGTHMPHKKILSYRITSCVLTSTRDKEVLLGNYEGEDFSGSSVRITVVPGAVRLASFSI